MIFSARVAPLFVSLLLVTACGSDETPSAGGGSGGTNAAGGTAGVTDPKAAADAVAAAQAAGLPGDLLLPNQIPELKSGSRLRLKYWVLDDGTRVATGVYDSQYQGQCNFSLTAKATWRCGPTGGLDEVEFFSNSSSVRVFADATCSDQVYRKQTDERVPYAPFVIEVVGNSNEQEAYIRRNECLLEVEPDPLRRFFTVIPVATTGLTLFSTNTPTRACEPERFSVSPSAQYFRIGPLAATTFVKGAKVQEDGKAWPVLQGEDGSQIWSSADVCAPTVPGVSTTPVSRANYVGAGRIKASSRTWDPYEIYTFYDSTRKEPCALEAVAEAPGQFRCLPESPALCSAAKNPGQVSATRTYVYKDAACSQLLVQISALEGLKDTTTICRIAPPSVAEGFYQIGTRVTFNGDVTYRKEADGSCQAIPEGVRSTYVEIKEQLPWTEFATVSQLQE